jgi:hypothetical protein
MTKDVNGAVVTLTSTSVTGSDEVTVDFNAQGWASETAPTTVTLDNGTTIEFGAGENESNSPKFYSGTKGVRVYAKNIITIKGTKPIAKVAMNCDSNSSTNYVGNELLYAKEEGNNVTICNDHTEAKGGAQLRVQTMVMTFEGEGTGGGGDTPAPTGAYLDESFANGKGNFTIDDKVFSGVWTAASYGSDSYMMATSYVKADGESAKTNHDAESWLISPEIDLSSATNPVLTFAQVINKFFGTIAEEAMVFAKKENGNWTKLTITYPATPSSSFSKFTDDGANVSVSLADYKSSKTQIAFVYKGSSTKAGTWEIKDVKVAEAAQ